MKFNMFMTHDKTYTRKLTATSRQFFGQIYVAQICPLCGYYQESPPVYFSHH